MCICLHEVCNYAIHISLYSTLCNGLLLSEQRIKQKYSVSGTSRLDLNKQNRRNKLEKIFMSKKAAPQSTSTSDVNEGVYFSESLFWQAVFNSWKRFLPDFIRYDFTTVLSSVYWSMLVPLGLILGAVQGKLCIIMLQQSEWWISCPWLHYREQLLHQIFDSPICHPFQLCSNCQSK